MSEDQDDRKPPPLMSQAQRRFLEAVEQIRLNQPTFDDLAYMARELVQVTLPHLIQTKSFSRRQ